MAAIKRAKELAARARQTAEARNRNRKSTDTRANSGKPAAQPKPARQTVYYRSKDDAKPVYRNPAKAKRPAAKAPARRTTYYSSGESRPKQAKLTRKWGVNFGNDFARTKRGDRMEMDTNESRLKDLNPKAQMDRDLAPGSDYRMRNWINSRVRDYPEDKGSTLAQANRLAALYRAVDPTTKGYTREQAGDLHKQIQSAPVDLQNLYIKYGSRLAPMIDAWPEDTGPHYAPKTRRVFGVPEDIAADTYSNMPYRTHWHEYGHNLDHSAGQDGIENNPLYSDLRARRAGINLDQVVAQDVDQSLRDYWAKVRLNESPYDPETALRQFGTDMQLTVPYAGKYAAGLSDMMGQYGAEYGGNTHPIGFGHSAEYWDDGSGRNKAAEAFADLSAAAVLGGPSLRYTQAVLPETYETYLEMLARMSAPKGFGR